MNGWPLPSNRHPVWQVLGWTLIAGTLGYSTVAILRGPKGLPGHEADANVFQPFSGTRGSLTEALGPSRLVLDYQSIEGGQEDLQLKGVNGKLEDSSGLWRMTSPKAHRQGGAWSLDAPLGLTLTGPQGAALGKGSVSGSGPGLRWEASRWVGLQPLVWEGDQGPGRGQWHLPAGWVREAQGALNVEHGPVTWKALEPLTLQSMESQSLWALPGFQEGHLSQVKAQLTEGQLEADHADISPQAVTWPAALHFSRTDGWTGNAAGGTAPRPAPGAAFQQVELRDFQAQRAVDGGREQIQARGARWTPAGLRLEGDVQWQQPYEKQILTLKSPRVLMREGAGVDLPENLPQGHALADAHPVITWGPRSLSAPSMEVDRHSRQWRLATPVMGRSEEGTFSGGATKGSPRAWSVEGPVQVSLFAGGQLRGASLLWEDATWTLLGRPATWTRLRERLTGARLVRRADTLAFPEGVQGTLAAPEGDLALRAGQGHSEPAKVDLGGGVECQGEGWRISADSATVFLGPGRVVTSVHASGNVSLRGRLGEGQGDALDLLMLDGQRTVRWQGRVRGQGEGPSW
jgi:hypothetical protein